MFQFQTLVRSRYSPLNIKTLILVVLIEAVMPMQELTIWLGGKFALHKQDTRSSSVDNVRCRCIFEDNYIFMDNFNISCRLNQSNF